VSTLTDPATLADPGPPRPAPQPGPPPRRRPSPPPGPTGPAGSGPYPATPPRPPDANGGPAPGEQKKGLTIAAEPLELRVEPGAPPAATTVTVRNKGSKVEHFTLAVNGLLAPYARIDPPVLQVFPGTEETAEVRFAVPRAPQPAAGRVPFQIAARGQVDADVHGRVAGALTIGRFDEISAALEPEMTRGRKPGQHRVTVVNRGNAPLNVQVALADQQGELSFDPSRFAGILAPGVSATQEVEVAAPVKWFGRTQVHPFTGNVTTDAPGQAAMLQGRRRQVPRFPWWVPMLVLALVALAIPIYALLPKATVPPVDGKNRDEAIALLTGAGYETVLPSEKSDPNIDPGLAIDTKPAANTPHPKNKPVLLFISSGPCTPPDCAVKMPALMGLPLADAQTVVTDAGLTVDRVNKVPGDRPPDEVVSTFPAAGQDVFPAKDNKVVLEVSTGPQTAAPTPPPSTAPGGGTGAPGGGSGGTAGAPTPMPNLAGMPLAAAQKALADSGLTVGSVVRTHTNKARADQVLSTTPAAGSPVPAKTPVTIEVAAPTAVDLVAAASTAKWSDQTGPIVFGEPPPPGRGAASLIPPETPLEDGSTGAAVGAQPGAVGGRVTAVFTLPDAIIAGDRLTAFVGLLPGAQGQVEFSVTANGRRLEPALLDAATDGALKSYVVDLTPVAGARTVQIDVTDKSVVLDDRAFWKDLRIEGVTG
jgi:beta-lactam-binding protein with PASTA domain